MLILVATPIGNLSDISYRAIETLKKCEYILCEDTRHSARLLDHYQITTQRRSLHKFNEYSQIDRIIEDLKNGLEIALISDAGTPGISDPGQELISRVLADGIKVTSIPGACAAVTALSISGLTTDQFQFVGFLPRKNGELKNKFLELLDYRGTTICYESPHRLISSLEMLAELSVERNIVVARELTKIHEERLQGTPKELIFLLSQKPVKGEIVLLIEGCKTDSSSEWEALSPQEHIAMVEKEYHVTRMEAVKIVSKLRGIPKRTIYMPTSN